MSTDQDGSAGSLTRGERRPAARRPVRAVYLLGQGHPKARLPRQPGP
ncbi:hypothetical protein ACI789_12220 [Geodermatophilus sp. SYSU D00965]